MALEVSLEIPVMLPCIWDYGICYVSCIFYL